MPTYSFRRKDGSEFSDTMRISDLDEYIKANPDLTIVPSMPLIGYRNMPKPPDSFRERMKEIKKLNPGSDMNVV